MKKYNSKVSISQRELSELRNEVAYLRRLSEQTIARMLRLDTDSIRIRHELEQKRRGFRLMAELSGIQSKHFDDEKLFFSVSRRLNAALGMQRTVILVPEITGLFRPAVLQGYPASEEAAIAERRMALSPEFLAPKTAVLVTGEDRAERFASIREALSLPFFIASPVYLQGELEAVLITGRLLEQQPYMPPLGPSDVETVQTVSTYMATLLTGRFLAEAEQRTQIMLDAMPLCCSFWDKNYNLVDCNEAAVRLFELAEKGEYLSKFYLLSPERQPDGCLSFESAQAKVQETFASGYTRFEWLHKKLNGELIPTEVTLVRIRRSNGYIVVGYTRDLREQKAMLAAMQKTQDELRQARDLAEESAKAKSEFLANMSHEVRTPMNAILGSAYLLGKTELSEKQRMYLEQTEHSANLLLRIINDILDFTKLDTDKIQIKVEKFSLRKLMLHVHDVIRGEAGSVSLRLYTNVDPQIPDELLGDPVRLSQIILNLMNNAVKFTSPGGKIVLRVSLQAVLPGKVRLRFTVLDTGIGMTAEQVTGLFLPFKQADTSATRRYGGTGLGLSVSQRLVALMDGEIFCESTPDVGSVFSFIITLPLADEPPAALHAERDGAVSAACENPLRGMRVLLAEDNEINQMIAEELLTAKDVNVTIVGTGQEALDALDAEEFALILMDIQMPGMDGLTATAHIRANPKYRDIPIIAMTAHALSGDREVSLKSGMNDHITKPIDPDVLYAALLRWDKRERKAPGSPGT